MNKYQYILFDGRYLTEPNDASVYSVEHTLKAAKETAKEYGEDTVIVKVELFNDNIIKREIV
jgi:hypothetical protein